MGKQGPCCHCGITSTPLWRNGPPEKPVLCNACGSRWRTKGTLANYTPIHARAFTPLDFGDSKNYREDKLPTSAKSKSWSMKVHNDCKIEDGHSFAAHYPYQTSFEDDTSNKSSSGSAISVSESCVQFGSTDGNEISGPYQASFCDFQIPSKKRTRTRRHSPSPVEKLRQDLVSILQQQDSSYLSEFSEEVLLFEGEDISFDSEIGHGSVLLKPSVSSKEEESEASSHVIGNKISCLSEAYMGSSCCSLQSQNNEISSGPSGKDQLSQVIWDINELKEDQGKECASTYRSLEGTVSRDPYVLQSKSSSQTSINEKLLNNGKTNPAKEAPSFTTDVTGNGVSVLTKRPRDSPYFHTYEGKSSGTTSTFKRPRERSHVEMLTSGEESVHIQASSLITKSVPPLPASVVSDVNSSMSTVQVENYFEPS